MPSNVMMVNIKPRLDFSVRKMFQKRRFFINAKHPPIKDVTHPMFYLTQVLWGDALKIFSFNELCSLIKDGLVRPKIENGNRRTSQECYSSVTRGDKSLNHKKKTWNPPMQLGKKQNSSYCGQCNSASHNFQVFLNSIDSETEQQSYLIQVLGIDLLVIISKDVVNFDTEHLFPACGL